MKKLVVTLFCLLCSLSVSYGQSIAWTAFENLNDSLRTEKKPILIFIHTNWCTYCKMQENFTFKDPELIHRFNKEYYCLKLNAEETAAIPFLNRTYSFQPAKGYNALAELLGSQNGELIFPTTVLLNKNLQIEKRLQGLLRPKELR